MTARTKGLIVAAAHVAIVCTLGAKLLADRATLPRVWVEVASYDPDLPIRGRYVRLQIIATPRGFEDSGDQSQAWGWARLSVEGDRLIATRTEYPTRHFLRIQKQGDRVVATLGTPVAFFIAEHAVDPSRRPGLMVEVSVPRKGPPRPVRLGIREGGTITPLEL
jgi:hypothetical protein